VLAQQPAQRALRSAVDRLVHSDSTGIMARYPKSGYSLDA
jgi:hypothetical protein